MKWGSPLVLYALPVVLLLAGIGMAWAQRRRDRLRNRFAGPGAKTWARPNAGTRARMLDRVLTLATVLWLGFALARPLWYRPDQQNELRGVPYLIALDASRSMLATDLRPSRWAVTTNALDRFLASTRADHIGLLTFSGVAYLNAPLTFDTLALRTMLRYLDPNVLEDPGSSLTSALDRAGRYFETNRITPRLMLLVSDGEDLTGNPVETARELGRRYQMKVYTMGVGTSSGSKVPLLRGGAARNSFGQEVVSRLNESNLQRLAAATGGRYFRLGDRGQGLSEFRESVLVPTTEAVAREDLKNYRELYQVPLALALMCLVGKIVLAADRRTVGRVPSAIRPVSGRNSSPGSKPPTPPV
ncbi:MAG: VWA domain-containing protein [Verrucomicrobiales bacterium]|nr:VWA domain-containing protein [Verrucomicrobiales bacterium]